MTGVRTKLINTCNILTAIVMAVGSIQASRICSLTDNAAALTPNSDDMNDLLIHIDESAPIDNAPTAIITYATAKYTIIPVIHHKHLLRHHAPLSFDDRNISRP